MHKQVEPGSIPSESLCRLSLYHCTLSDWIPSSGKRTVTSKELADILGLNEATVRRDLSYLSETLGTRGVGYNINDLMRMIADFLSLPSFAPVVFVGGAATINSLFNFFPITKFNFVPVAFFSEEPDDVGLVIYGQGVKSIEDISTAINPGEVNVALVAVHPSWLRYSINLLVGAGIKSILVLTQAMVSGVPEGVHATQLGITCELKSMFYHANLLKQQS